LPSKLLECTVTSAGTSHKGLWPLTPVGATPSSADKIGVPPLRPRPRAGVFLQPLLPRHRSHPLHSGAEGGRFCLDPCFGLMRRGGEGQTASEIADPAWRPSGTPQQIRRGPIPRSRRGLSWHSHRQTLRCRTPRRLAVVRSLRRVTADRCDGSALPAERATPPLEDRACRAGPARREALPALPHR